MKQTPWEFVLPSGRTIDHREVSHMLYHFRSDLLKLFEETFGVDECNLTDEQSNVLDAKVEALVDRYANCSFENY